MLWNINILKWNIRDIFKIFLSCGQLWNVNCTNTLIIALAKINQIFSRFILTESKSSLIKSHIVIISLFLFQILPSHLVALISTPQRLLLFLVGRGLGRGGTGGGGGLEEATSQLETSLLGSSLCLRRTTGGDITPQSERLASAGPVPWPCDRHAADNTSRNGRNAPADWNYHIHNTKNAYDEATKRWARRYCRARRCILSLCGSDRWLLGPFVGLSWVWLRQINKN